MRELSKPEHLIPFALEAQGSRDAAKRLGIVSATFYKRLREHDLRLTWDMCQAISIHLPRLSLPMKYAFLYGWADASLNLATGKQDIWSILQILGATERLLYNANIKDGLC